MTSVYNLKDINIVLRKNSDEKNKALKHKVNINLSKKRFFGRLKEEEIKKFFKKLVVSCYYLRIKVGFNKENTNYQVFNRFFKLCESINIRFSGELEIGEQKVKMPKFYFLNLINLDLTIKGSINLDAKQLKIIVSSTARVLKIYFVIEDKFSSEILLGLDTKELKNKTVTISLDFIIPTLCCVTSLIRLKRSVLQLFTEIRFRNHMSSGVKQLMKYVNRNKCSLSIYGFARDRYYYEKKKDEVDLLS